jgi:quinoprotein glucose dehydrogenase
MRFAICAVCAVVLTTLLAGGWTTLPQSRSVWTGVYTKDQADRGRRLYVRECAECHAQNLMGAEGGSALVGDAFLGPWLQKTVGDLYESV